MCLQESSSKPAEGDVPVAMDTGIASPTPKEAEGKSTESDNLEASSSWATASRGDVGNSDSGVSAVTALDSSSTDTFMEATPSSGPAEAGGSGKADKVEGGDKVDQTEKKAPEPEKKGPEPEKKEPEPEKKEPEPNFQLLSNPARVLPQQVCVVGIRLWLVQP